MVAPGPSRRHCSGLASRSTLAWCCDQKQLLAGIPLARWIRWQPRRRQRCSPAFGTTPRAAAEHRLQCLEELVTDVSTRGHCSGAVSGGLLAVGRRAAMALHAGPGPAGPRSRCRSCAGHCPRCRLSGGAKATSSAYPRHFHHAENLYRYDLPGWLELRNLAGKHAQRDPLAYRRIGRIRRADGPARRVRRRACCTGLSPAARHGSTTRPATEKSTEKWAGSS